MKEFCPRCGTARVGAFRFCRGCRLDFDTIAIDAEPAALPIAAAAIAPPPVMIGRSGRRFSGRAMFGTGLAVVVGIAALGSLQKPDPGSSAANSTATPTARAVVVTASPTGIVSPTRTSAPTFGPTGPTTEARVLRVTDGDTIVVAIAGREYRVRYIGMDSPETVDPNSSVQWMGPQATAANAALVEGKTVVLEKDVSETDQFDRLLRHVWLTDGAAWTLVNLELVRQGVAFAKSYPPDTRFDDVYRDAEREARVAAVGLWGPTPAPPLPTLVPFVNSEPEPVAECHPNYDPCLPIVADLDCADIRAMGKDPVRVIGSDPYRLDGTDDDGLGCE